MASSTLKNVRLGLYALAAAAVVAQLYFAFIHPKLNPEAGSRLGAGEYVLQATDGTEFTHASLTGAPTAVFFGFTHCPEVCPTTLGDIGAWQDDLGEELGDLRFYFVTVDPERDTLDLLDGYVGWLDGAAGVTGPRTEIDKAIKAFRIYAAKVDLGDGEYNMDHSAHILLFDSNGRFVEPISYQEDYDLALSKLRNLIAM